MHPDARNDTERRLRHELRQAATLGPPAPEDAIERARRRYLRHRATVRAGGAAGLVVLLGLLALVPGRVLAGRAPAPPAARQTNTATTVPSWPPISQMVKVVRVSPRQGPPGTQIHVAGTDCGVSDEGTPRLILALAVHRPDGSSYSIDHALLPVRRDGNWNGTLTVPRKTRPGIDHIDAHCVLGGRGTFNEPVSFRVTSPRR